MSSPTEIPAPPDFGYTTPKPKRILWKWTFAVLAVGLAWMMWQCGWALHAGSKLADGAVRRFHMQLNNAEYDQICREADEAFLTDEKREQLLHFLEAVHRKLGNVDAETQSNLRVNATTGGTFIIAVFTTRFTSGQATETFTWRKSGNTLKLYGYHIESEAIFKDFDK
jgi:hypothetical protein